MKIKRFGLLFLLISFVITVVVIASEPYKCEDYTECRMHHGYYFQSFNRYSNAITGRWVAVDPHDFLQDLIDNKHRFQPFSGSNVTIQDLIQNIYNMIERGESIYVVNFD